MSAPFDGFVGPSYQLSNRYAAIERTVNRYLIPNETGEEKKYVYVAEPCPANKAFSTLPVPAPFNQPNRGLLELRGRVFGVNGSVAFEILADGSYVNLGTVRNDGNPCVIYANGNGQVFIGAGTKGTGDGYVIPAGAGAGSLISLQANSDYLGCVSGTFQDGYGINAVPNSNQIQISGTDDAPVGDLTKWSALNISAQAGQADNLRGVISSREYLRLLGYRRSQVYQNVGANGIGGFPFQSYNETFIETGLAALFALSDLGDSLIWIGEDARGQRACWRDAAFQPQRVSTFAVEQFWQSYPTLADAVAFPMIWKGHLIWQVTFPSAKNATGATVGATWWHDVTASQITGRQIWTERSYFTPGGGMLNPTDTAPQRAEMFHCYAFGLHLVGSGGADGNPGAIYQLSDSQFFDCGADPNTGAQIQSPLVRDRITPHVYGIDQNIIYSRLTIEAARGQGAVTGQGVDPQLQIRQSVDGGNTWGNEIDVAMGMQGQYSTRIYANRLAYAPRGGGGAAFWMRDSDPAYSSLISAQLDFIACAP